MSTARNIYSNLCIYSFAHAVVDASCILLLLSGINAQMNLLFYVILYNVLAFGLQAPFGWISDKLKKPELLSSISNLLIIAGLLCYRDALIATVLVGVGNALFHVSTGTIALNLRKHKSALPGVFVSTGTLGLFVGGLMAKTLGYYPYIFVVLLAAQTLAFYVLPKIKIYYIANKIKWAPLFYITIILLLLIILMRSVIGLSLNYAWKDNIGLLIAFTIAIALGKGIGGFLSDKFGWLRITITSLFISSVCLYFGYTYAIAGIVGIFLFNFTMPVTLVAISNLMPGRPGFAFGLTTFALLIGALPSLTGLDAMFSSKEILTLLVLISTILLYIALRFYNKQVQ